jgi:hypothetical protein
MPVSAFFQRIGAAEVLGNVTLSGVIGEATACRASRNVIGSGSCASEAPESDNVAARQANGLIAALSSDRH